MPSVSIRVHPWLKNRRNKSRHRVVARQQYVSAPLPQPTTDQSGSIEDGSDGPPPEPSRLPPRHLWLDRTLTARSRTSAPIPGKRSGFKLHHSPFNCGTLTRQLLDQRRHQRLQAGRLRLKIDRHAGLFHRLRCLRADRARKRALRPLGELQRGGVGFERMIGVVERIAAAAEAVPRRGGAVAERSRDAYELIERMGATMKITPLDIQQMVFRTKLRGYDREEVNRFLEELAQTVETLNRDNAMLRERLAMTEQQVSELKRTEMTLSNTLVSAQSLADDVKRSAQRDAELIVKEAELKAGELIRQARVELGETQRDLSQLQKQRLLMVERMRATLHTFERMLDVEAALARRTSQSGLEEKASRQPG